MSNVSRRTTPVTGSDAQRLFLVNLGGILLENEIHTTLDQHRLFMDGDKLLSGGAWHGIVADESDMLALNVMSERGCFPMDMCYRTDVNRVYLCVAGRGLHDIDWISWGGEDPLDSDSSHTFFVTAAEVSYDSPSSGGLSATNVQDAIDELKALIDSISGGSSLPPNAVGFLHNDGVGGLVWTAAGTGTISGTGTDNHLMRWDGTTDAQDSGWTLDDSDNLFVGGSLPSSTSFYIKRSGHSILTMESSGQDARMRMVRADTSKSAMMEFIRGTTDEWYMGTPYTAATPDGTGNQFVFNFYDGTDHTFLSITTAGNVVVGNSSNAGTSLQINSSTYTLLQYVRGGASKFSTGTANSANDFITGTVQDDIAFKSDASKSIHFSTDNGSTSALKLKAGNTGALFKANSGTYIAPVSIEADCSAGLTLDLNNTHSGGSKKSQISFLSQGTLTWALGSDANENGGQDFFIYDNVATDFRFQINSSGLLRLKAYGAGVLTSDASGNITATAAGTGTIIGGTGSTDNRLIRADGIGGLTIQGSNASLDDNAILSLLTTAAGGLLLNNTSTQPPYVLYALSGTNKALHGIANQAGDINNNSATGDLCFRTIVSGNVFRFSADNGTNDHLKIDSTGVTTPGFFQAGGSLIATGYTSFSGVGINYGVSGGVGYFQSLSSAVPNQLSIDATPLIFRGASYTETFRIDTTRALFAVPIKTPAPSGGTAADWKVGSKITTSVTPDLTGYIEVDIGGTLYKLALVT